MQSVVHTIEVIEQAGHGADLYDLSLIVIAPEPGEKNIVDGLGVGGETLGPGQRGLLGIGERAMLVVEQLLELFAGGTEPRRLRGM